MTLFYQTLTYIIAYVAFGGEEKFFHFFAFFGISLGCLYMMRNIINRQPRIFYVLSIAQLVSLYFLVSFPLPVSFFLTVVFYIMYGNVKKENRHYMFASVGFIGISIILNATEQHVLLMGLLVSQLLVYAMITSNTGYERKWKLGGLAFLAVCTFIFTYFSFILEFLVKGILGNITNAIVAIFNAVVWVLGQFIQVEKLEHGKKKGQPTEFTNEDAPDQKELLPERTPEMDVFSIIVAIVVIVVIAYFVMKKLKESKGDHVFAGISNSIKGKFKPQTEVVLRAPSNPVRNKVFHLEKNMKNSYARRKGETFEQWMNRLRKIQKFPEGSDDIAHIYNRVRYGDETASKEEVARLNEFYKEIRRRGKDARE